MATERLQLEITASDRGTKSAFNSVTGDIGNLERQAIRAAQTIQNSFMNMAREIQRAIQSVQASFSNLSTPTYNVRTPASHPGAGSVSGSGMSMPFAVPLSAGRSIFGSRVAGSLSEARIWDIERELSHSEAYRRLYEKTGNRSYARKLDEHYYRFEAMQEANNYLAGKIGGQASSGDAAANAAKNVSSANNSLAESAKNAANATKGLGDSMAGQMVKGVALFAAIQQGAEVLKAWTLDAAKAAAAAKTYETAMYAIAKANGVSASSVRQTEGDLRKLGISISASRQVIGSAIAGEIPLESVTGTKARKGEDGLARLAQNLAVLNPNTTSSESLQRLLHGIRSAEKEVLQTAGINVNFEQGYRRTAQELRKNVDNLTEYEKMLSRVATVLREGSKFNGLYEQSQTEVGKQMQTLKRLAEDAAISVGQNLVPALTGIVGMATSLAKTVQENPWLSKLIAVGGSAAIGAGAGAIVGSVVPGIGTGIGAVLGGGFAAGTSLFSVAQADEETRKAKASQSTNDKIADEEAKKRAAEIRRLREEEERKSRATAAAAESAKRTRQAERDALNDLRRAQESELEGLQRILAEHKNKIAALKEEGVLTKRVGDLRAQETAQMIRNLTARENKEFRDQFGNTLRDADEARKERSRTSLDAGADEWMRIADKTEQGYREFAQKRNDLRQQELLDFQSHLDRQHQLELANLSQTQAVTLQQKMGLEQQKLAIDLDYIQKSRDAELRNLAFKAEIARREVAIRYAGRDQMIKNLQTLINLEQQAGEKAIIAAADDQTKLAQKQTVNNQFAMIADANRRLYDQLKQSAEGIFDAILTRSQSVWQAMANAFKMAFLTVFKEIVSSQIARSLTGMLTGQNVGLASGGGNMTGRAGGWASMLGGLGLGSVPVFGRPAATTPPFNPNAAMITPVPGMVGVGQDQNGSLVNMATGQIMGSAGLFGTKGAQAMFGKMGKFGGAAQTGLMMGGFMLGADGLQRGGLTGMFETAAGGAMIGAAFGGPVGAVIGAGIGAAVGGIRMLFKSPEDKMKERIKALTGLNVNEKNLLKQAVEMAKGQSGGNFDLWIRSKSGQDFLEMYALNTGKQFRSAFNARSFTFAQSGGSLYETPSYLGGSAMGQMSSLPGLGFSAALDNVRGSGMGSGPMSVTLSIDGPATQQLMRGEAVNVIADNPRLIQASATAALTSNSGRREMASSLMSPGLVTG